MNRQDAKNTKAGETKFLPVREKKKESVPLSDSATRQRTRPFSFVLGALGVLAVQPETEDNV